MVAFHQKRRTPQSCVLADSTSSPRNRQSEGELQIVPDTQENPEHIARHSFSFSRDAGLPGGLFTVQADEGRLALGYVEGQCRISRPSD